MAGFGKLLGNIQAEAREFVSYKKKRVWQNIKFSSLFL